jgi:hypothetical protein
MAASFVVATLAAMVIPVARDRGMAIEVAGRTGDRAPVPAGASGSMEAR